MTAVRSLFVSDMRKILRDPLLRFLLIYPWILGLVMRWLVSFVTAELVDTFDLVLYHVLIASFFGILITPALAGYVIGFLLLDERDDQTLAALQVTPLSVNQYIGLRVAVPMVMSIVSTWIVLALMNLTPVSNLRLLPIGVLAALEAPLYALLLSSLANNKVQGLAIMKGMGILFLAPFVAWFVPLPWQWLLSIFPTYWPVKAFWLQEAGQAWGGVITIGLIIHVIYLVLLLRRFQKIVYS